MIDDCGRDIDYLRLSVTDLCNLRCIYCMPEGGVTKLRHGDTMSIEEIEGIAHAAARLGIRKVRLTGGEPLVRRGIVDIVRRVSSTPGIKETALTTNGTLLADFAEGLKAAGLSRVNISIDSMDEGRYREITRGGELADALSGIRAAAEAGLSPIKLNAVLMGGINDDYIRPLVEMTRTADFRVRFIEIMPIGECADWNQGRFLSVSKVLETVPGLMYAGTDGVSKLYRLPGSKGSVGLISPISNHFCPTCNKIRVTADGKLKPCLHSAEEIPLRGLSGEALLEAVRRGIAGKPLKHRIASSGRSDSARGMSAIGG